MIRRSIAAGAALTLTAGLLAVSSTGSASSQTDCTPRTAWAGVESSHLQGRLLDQWPATDPVTVTSVTISWAYAPLGNAAPATFREALLLAGTSAGPLDVGPGELPTFIPAQGWGVPSWQTSSTGTPVNGNTQISGGVFAARILKTAGPPNAADDSITVPLDRQVPAGGVLWVFLGTVPGFDVEAQTVATYQPAGC